MSNSVNVFIYLGSGEEGQDMEALIRREAKKRGFVNRKGEAKISPFVIHCINYTVSHEKK